MEVPEQVAKLEAKWQVGVACMSDFICFRCALIHAQQEREAEKVRRREQAATVTDPAENAHVFWQVIPAAMRK